MFFLPTPTVVLYTLQNSVVGKNLSEVFKVGKFLLLNMPEDVQYAPKRKPVVDYCGVELSEMDVKKRINSFREKLTEDKNLSIPTDDLWLTRWLFPTHFNVEKAHARIRAFYKLKAENPSFYYTGTPEKIHDIISYPYKVMLDERDRDGRKIFITKLGKIPNNLTFLDLVYTDDLWVEGALLEPETQQNGMSAIVDMANCPWRCVKWLTPYNIRVGAQKSELCPLTDLRYHVVNTSALLNGAIAFIFPFLSAQTKERIHFHYNNWESLHKFVSPDVLPPEYGGSAKEIDHESQVKKTIYDRANLIMESFKATFTPKSKSDN